MAEALQGGGEIDQGGEVVRVVGDGFAEGLAGLVHAAEAAERGAAVGEGVGEARLERPVGQGQASCVIAQLQAADRQGVQHLAIGRRLLQGRDGPPPVALGRQQQAERAHHGGPRRDLVEVAQDLFGLGQLAGLPQAFGEADQFLDLSENLGRVHRHKPRPIRSVFGKRPGRVDAARGSGPKSPLEAEYGPPHDHHLSVSRQHSAGPGGVDRPEVADRG
ncbi:MAG: hypothetical protein WDN45_03215 [Caulobacteraceae bacterium]